MSIFKYLTLSHLQKVLAALDQRFRSIENKFNLTSLSDMSITSPNNNQILIYNITTNKWENGDIPDDVIKINITQGVNGETWEADKTFSEILSYINSGRDVVCKYYDYIYQLIVFNNNNIVFSYSNIHNDEGLSGLSYVEGNEITILSNGSITMGGYTSSIVPTVSTTVPLMDGVAYKGDNQFNYACDDHVHPTDTTRAAVSDVLTKTNTTSYTPTSDYHPATKKYVDDAIPTVPTKVSDLTNDSGFITSYTETDPIFLASAAHGITSSDITNWNGKANSSDVLTKTNTTAYTPTANYHPATKKYVDDATSGITTNLSGLTDTTISSPTDGQLLKYNATTSKWENVTLSLAISGNTIQLKEGNTVISSVTLPIYNGGVSS